MCTNFMDQEDNRVIVWNNIYRYKKQLKEKIQKNKGESCMEHMIRKTADEGNNQQDIDPIVKLTRLFQIGESDSEIKCDDDSSTLSEE